MTKAWCLVGLCLQGISDVLWRLVFSSYKGYLDWFPRALGVEKLECPVLACRRNDRDHEAGHVAAPLNRREMPGAEADRYAAHALSSLPNPPANLPDSRHADNSETPPVGEEGSDPRSRRSLPFLSRWPPT
jgi:hypothetical protein